MDIIASIDDQIERLKAMRAHLVVEQKAKFDAAQLALPIADDGRITHVLDGFEIESCGWVKFYGGENPAGNSRVQVWYRDSSREMARADKLNWSWSYETGPGEDVEIIAYRIAGERT